MTKPDNPDLGPWGYSVSLSPVGSVSSASVGVTTSQTSFAPTIRPDSGFDSTPDYAPALLVDGFTIATAVGVVGAWCVVRRIIAAFVSSVRPPPGVVPSPPVVAASGSSRRTPRATRGP